MSEPETDGTAWRGEMLGDLASGDVVRATRALLSLTFNEPDRPWVEGVLLEQLAAGCDPQVRALAVTCMGHVGRVHGEVSRRVLARLEALQGDPVLGGIAEDALGDVRRYAQVV